MTSEEHYREGERLLAKAGSNEVVASPEAATLLTLAATAHFTAALAYASIETLRHTAARRRLQVALDRPESV